MKPKVEQKARKYVLAYYEGDNNNFIIGTREEIEEQLKIDSDMGDLPEHPDNIKIYEIAREIDFDFTEKVFVKVNWDTTA